MIAARQALPVDMRGRAIYYVGPVKAVRDEVVGPAGPTTGTRMDDFTEVVLRKTGLLALVGADNQVTIPPRLSPLGEAVRDCVKRNMPS